MNEPQRKATTSFYEWYDNTRTVGLRLEDLRIGYEAGYAALETQLATARELVVAAQAVIVYRREHQQNEIDMARFDDVLIELHRTLATARAAGLGEK